MSSIDLPAELNRIRERLLDLSNRNPLLSYRVSRTRTLEIADELPDQVFQRLVGDGKRFRFDPHIEEPKTEAAMSLVVQETASVDADISADDVEIESPTLWQNGSDAADRHTDDRLQTLLSPQRLEAVLKSMGREAASAIEETGVNYLFLAVGMLAWREREDSEKIHRAPLLLIPVQIDRFFDGRSGKYENCVGWRGDELQYNLCLARRLEKDFALRLPPHDGDQAPEEYFREVERAVQSKATWAVKRDMLLGFFAFQKLHMYLDLDPATWVNRNALVEGSIAGQIIAGGAFEGGSCLYAPDYEIDDHPDAAKIAVVTDADSSQHSALCDIASGKNLVIEGPPGTGKSQTITNAIAAAINEGKNVLFVAEKLAALKVVSDRLQHLGLGQLCLELHSDGGPRQAFASIKERMNATFARPQQLESTRADLERRRASIAGYLAACAQSVGPYQEPLYEVMWRTIEMRSRGIRSAREATFDPNVDRAQFDKNVHNLETFVEALEEVNNPRESVWWGFWTTRINPNDLKPVEQRLRALSDIACNLDRSAAEMESACGEGLVGWLRQGRVDAWTRCESLADAAERLPRTDGLAIFLARDARNQARVTLDELRRAKRLLAESSTFIVSRRSDAEAVCGEVSRCINTTLPRVISNVAWRTLLKIKARLTTLVAAIDKVRTLGTTLEKQQLGAVRTLGEYSHAEFLYRLLRHPAAFLVEPMPSAIFLSSAQATIQQGQAETSRLKTEYATLGKAFQLDRLPDSEAIQSVASRLRPHVGTRWCYFLKSYWTARSDLFKFCRSGIGRTADAWVENLETLEDHFAARTNFGSRTDLAAVLGPLFSGMDTDWEKATQLLQWAAAALGRGLDHAAVDRLMAAKAATDFGPRQLIDAREQLLAELSQEVVARILDIGSSVESATLSDIRVKAVRLVDDITALADAASVFHTPDDLTLGELARRAESVDLAGRLRDAVSSLADEGLRQWIPGMEADVDAVAAAVDWTESLTALSLPNSVAESIVGDRPGEACRRLAHHLRRVQETCNKWSPARQTLAEFGRLDDSWLPLFDEGGVRVIAAEAAAGLLAAIDDLPEWSALCRILERCESQKLRSITSLTLDGELDAALLRDVYRLTIFEHAVEAKLWRADALKNFSRQSLEKAREHFRELDRQLLKLTRMQVAHEGSLRKAPPGNAKGRVAEFTEMGLVNNEVRKQMRHCRIRDLLACAGQAVQALKPCMMMSPLSVAQYLDPAGIQFDLVIMDEASQIKPEDALGTLLRAKQIVVVGDPKQLPPTSFFDRTDDGVADSEATPIDNAESVLEVAMKAFPRVRRLRWHYRSQHESLIHFSNDRFYDQDLVVFPSATTDAGRLGIRHHFVEGATFVGSANVAEATVVAKAIVEHAKASPHETLGVGTFNLKQRDCILEILDKICEQDPAAREAVDRLNENHDKLFVKNLESLQGDERDVIFISYTYGPDSDSGKVMNRFGPINGSFGWRRLNVLITRARRRVEVFSSLKSSDIMSGPDKSLGVNAMKDYLEFAKVGRLPDRGLASGREPDSPFEVAVARVITRMGLDVVPQVGVAGYRIDLGVLKPNSQGDFILGIECDGAAYHSSKSARDRDRLREEVIRTRGWNIHRIWSTDWFLNQKHEEERLIEAIRRSLPEPLAT